MLSMAWLSPIFFSTKVPTSSLFFFFLNDPAPPEFSPFSLPDSLPFRRGGRRGAQPPPQAQDHRERGGGPRQRGRRRGGEGGLRRPHPPRRPPRRHRRSRLGPDP